MKIRIYMKTPDAVEYALQEAFPQDESREDNGFEETKELLQKWFQYGEAVTLEVDTETKTCTVVER